MTRCMWCLLPVGFPHYAWTAQSAHFDFVGSRVFTCLSVSCHLYFWQNDCGRLRAFAVTRGGMDTEWKLAHKVHSREENYPAASARTRTRNLSITSSALYQQAISLRNTTANKSAWRNAYSKYVRNAMNLLVRQWYLHKPTYMYFVSSVLTLSHRVGAL